MSAQPFANARPSLPPMGEGQKPSKIYGHLNIPAEVQSRWTSTLNLVSEIMDVSSVVVTRLHKRYLEIVAGNDEETNPFKQAMLADLDTGMCCEAVMYGRRTLWVPNATTDPEWDSNPNVSFGLVAYLGFPLVWPNGDIFGTMALLDSKEHHYSTTDHRILKKFKEAVEADIELLVELAERERIQKELAAACDAAEVANRAKSTFLANMSHELRTPLNAILGYTELLGRDPDLSTERKDQLNIIGRSGQHLLTLINDVLALSRVEASMAQLSINAFDLNQLLTDTVAMFNLKAESKGIALVLAIDNTLPPVVSGDAVKLSQILINLLGNAMKFTEHGKIELRVTAQVQQSDIRINFTISDTGCGIAADDLEKIFEPFAQSTDGVLHQGAGLGLAISSGFVQLMGGKLIANSKLGVGSTFSFDISAKAANYVAPETSNSHIVGVVPNPSKHRILICEDVLESRTLLHALLKPQGFELRDAVNGHEAVEMAVSWKPNAILMDLRMPIIDGYEATQRIRALEGPNTPIIAITASAFEDEEAAALQAGCNLVIRKPFESSKLYTALADALDIPVVRETTHAHADEASKMLDCNDFAAFDTTWRTAVFEAANAADRDLLEGLACDISRQCPDAAANIHMLMNEFRFDRIAELVKP